LWKLHKKRISLLITADKDFGYLIYKQQLKCPGVVLIRVTDEKLQGSKIVGCLRKYKAKLAGNFVVITDKKIRIRPFHTAG
jgi:predicted nuclease of predicted toxin-antitoxin system